MYPALTATARMPRSRQASATSIAYSMKITGSLYVNATLRQPNRFLLDRVHAEPRRAAVTGEDYLVGHPPPDEAQPTLSLVQFAGARADVALDPPVGQAVPVTGRHRVRVAEAEVVGRHACQR